MVAGEGIEPPTHSDVTIEIFRASAKLIPMGGMDLGVSGQFADDEFNSIEKLA